MSAILIRDFISVFTQSYKGKKIDEWVWPTNYERNNEVMIYMHAIKLEVLKRKSKASPCCLVIVKGEFQLRGKRVVGNNIGLSYFLLTENILKLRFKI